MKTKHYLHLLPVLLLGLTHITVEAQDIHFSQYYNSPLTLSPALTGMSAGDLRFTGMYRNQWNAANASYKTMQVSAENRFYTIAHTDWWFSGGLNVYYDRAGDANIEHTYVQLSGSYTKMVSQSDFLSLGAYAGFGQRTFDFARLTFDNQWNGDIFDPTRSVNENFNDTNLSYPDFGIGFNYRGQNSRFSQKPRTKLDLGAAGYHLSRPGQNFKSNDNSRLPVRLSMYILPTIQLNGTSDLVGSATIQIQGEYREALAGAAYRLHLSTKKAREMAVQFGVGYRFFSNGDALIPAAEFHYRQFMVGLSWDVNMSDFSVATNRNGGPELVFRYLIKKVYPLKAFKACPLI